MAVETIVARIAEDADAEIASILGEADARAAALVSAARTERRARVTAALERAEPAAQAEETRAVNAVRLRLLERRAARSAIRTTRVFDAAEGCLRRIADGDDPDRWAAALARLAAEAVALTGPGAVVRVRPADAPFLRTVATELGVTVEPLAPGAAGPGPVVRSADGRIEVDATLRSRLGTARARLAEPVARLLRLEG